MFIHDAVVEAVMSRDTSVTSDLLHAYVSDLLTPGATGRTRMDKQFKVFLNSLKALFGNVAIFSLIEGSVFHLSRPDKNKVFRPAAQLISQRQARHADYSTALRDGNAERNRARALMPGKLGCFGKQLRNVRATAESKTSADK